MQIRIKAPYLVFLGDEPERLHAKTGVGIAHWRPALCTGQYRLPGSGVDLGLPDMTPAEAKAAGAATMIWGVAGVGGTIPPHWVAPLFEAAAAGLDVCAGTHSSLSAVPVSLTAAKSGALGTAGGVVSIVNSSVVASLAELPATSVAVTETL